jgi:hypothetical protein
MSRSSVYSAVNATNSMCSTPRAKPSALSANGAGPLLSAVAGSDELGGSANAPLIAVPTASIAAPRKAGFEDASTSSTWERNMPQRS